MHSVQEILTNRCLLCAILAWIVAQIAKGIITSCKNHAWKIRNFIGSGRMPSAHTGSVIALALMVGSTEGFGSPLFAVCALVATVVIYDAAGVRLETEKQGRIITKLVDLSAPEKIRLLNDKLKEKVGHTPGEILGGAIVGIVCFCIFSL